MIREKKFYTSFLALCLPIILQNVISLGVNLADNLMLGRFAEASLSGATAVNQIQFVYQNILIGIGDGMVIIASQYWGAGRTEPIKRVASVAMRTALIFMEQNDELSNWNKLRIINECQAALIELHL